METLRGIPASPGIAIGKAYVHMKGMSKEETSISGGQIASYKGESLAQIVEEVIVVTKKLTPSDTVQMNPKNVLGFATDLGGITSHAAIIAREYGIPAVVGIGDVTEKVKPGDLIIMDGYKGLVVINPNKETINQYLNSKLQMKLEC